LNSATAMKFAQELHVRHTHGTYAKMLVSKKVRPDSRK
jgi:hypothetical protein